MSVSFIAPEPDSWILCIGPELKLQTSVALLAGVAIRNSTPAVTLPIGNTVVCKVWKISPVGIPNDWNGYVCWFVTISSAKPL